MCPGVIEASRRLILYIKIIIRSGDVTAAPRKST
jgi:hypothetical protein